MTKEYKITTSCTLITEYVVEANAPEEAEDMFIDGGMMVQMMNGGLPVGNCVDYLDETIDKIEVVNEGDTNE